ncbi:MAG: N-acetyltransferase family protein [Saprospiraceae bacterium]
MKIRPLQPEDWPSVRRIYQEGIETGLATFETEVPDWDVWNTKFLPMCRLILEHENKILGWAVLSPVSKRYVYRGVAEVTIYRDLKCTQKGIGSILMSALIECSEEENFWTLQSSIFPENKPSLYLHEKFGFRVVGKRERIAQRNGKWKDIIFMERRSSKVD